MGFSAEIHSWPSQLPRTSTGCYLGCTRSHRQCSGALGRATPETREANSKSHTVFPAARAEPQGSGLWGMVLSCPSIPLNLSSCHGKGEGWRKQLCCYSYKLSTLVTTTSPSLTSAHTVTTWAWGLVRSQPGSVPAAVLAAVPVGKQGFLPLPQALTSEEGNCEHWGWIALLQLSRLNVI